MYIGIIIWLFRLGTPQTLAIHKTRTDFRALEITSYVIVLVCFILFSSKCSLSYILFYCLLLCLARGFWISVAKVIGICV